MARPCRGSCWSAFKINMSSVP